MSWTCSGNSNAELIDNLVSAGILPPSSSPLTRAFQSVDRAHFSPVLPYADSPQRIGYDATISAPHMHAHALTSLLPALKPDAAVLDIGSGSGYLCAVLAHLCPQGEIVGVEHIRQLNEMAEKNFEKDATLKKWLAEGKVRFVTADGRKGLEREGGWDAVHVGAAAKGWEGVEVLVGQLKPGGRVFVPVEEESGAQYVWEVQKKEDGETVKKRWGGVMYVPLTDAKEFP